MHGVYFASSESESDQLDVLSFLSTVSLSKTAAFKVDSNSNSSHQHPPLQPIASTKMEDDTGGLFSITLSDSEPDETSSTAPVRDRTGQTEEEWQAVKQNYRARVENGEVSSLSVKAVRIPPSGWQHGAGEHVTDSLIGPTTCGATVAQGHEEASHTGSAVRSRGVVLLQTIHRGEGFLDGGVEWSK